MPFGNAACPGPPAALRDAAATVRENAAVAPGFHRMRIDAPALAGAFAPGQFFQLLVDAASPFGPPLLRRPFAPSECLADGFAFVYAVVGEGTRRMAALAPGADVKVMAPLGRGFALPERAGAPALLVGGGCGTPSLRPLAEALARAGHPVGFAAGAVRASALLETKALAKVARLGTATDDGSAGVRGTALDAADRLLAEADGFAGGASPAVYACGPRGMLRAVASWAAARGWACQVSLEERMACGFGACMGCAVALRDAEAPGGVRYGRVCHDGPVFDAARVAW